MPERTDLVVMLDEAHYLRGRDEAEERARQMAESHGTRAVVTLCKAVATYEHEVKVKAVNGT